MAEEKTKADSARRPERRSTLSRTTELFERFASELRSLTEDIRSEAAGRWSTEKNAAAKLLIEDLDEALLWLLERQLYFTTLLKEQHSRSDVERNEKRRVFADPAPGVDGGMDHTLVALDKEIAALRSRVQPESEGAESEVRDLAVFPSKVVSVVSGRLLKLAEASSLSLSEMEKKLDHLRRTEPLKPGVRINTPGGKRELALDYFRVNCDEGGHLDYIDLKNFVRDHRLALEAAAQLSGLPKDSTFARRKTSAYGKVRQFLLAMLQGARLEEGGKKRKLPYTGGAVTGALLLNFEALLSLWEWTEDAYVTEYSMLFQSRAEKPLMEALSTPVGRRRYYESILFPVSRAAEPAVGENG